MANGIYYNSTAGTLSFFVNNQPSIEISSGGTTTISGTTVFDGTISATTIVSPSLDITITGGSYNSSSGIISLSNSTGGTVGVSGVFQYVTGGTYSAGTITLNTNTGGTTNITGLVGGIGTQDYVPKWTGSTSLGDSQIFDNGSFVGIAIAGPTYGESVSIATGNKGILIDDLYIIQTGNGSIGFGTGNDYSVWGGSGEIAIGTRGVLINSTGSGNIGIGDKALASNTIGTNNIAMGGTGSLMNNNDGTDNISLGTESLNQNSSGNYNISLGTESLYNNLGNRNVSIGVGAGYTNGNRDRNVYIGYNAGYSNDGSSNIFIGDSAGSSDTNSNNRLIIGDTIYGDLNTKLIGINVSNPSTTLDVGGTLRTSGGLTASTVSATTYYNLPVSGLTQGTNVTITNNGSGNYTINATGGGGISGSGTSNYLPKWTGTTGLGNSRIQDNGTYLSIGNQSPSSAALLSLNDSINSTYFYGLYSVSNNSSGRGVFGVGNESGVYGSHGGSSSNPIGIKGYVYNGGTGIGVEGIATVQDGYSLSEGIGGHFFSGDIGDGYEPITKYGVWIEDGTEGVDKVLVSVTSDGKANWSNTLTGLTSVSATTYYNLPISGVTDGSGISTSITNGNLTITATGGGGGGLTFQQVQMIAFLTS